METELPNGEKLDVQWVAHVVEEGGHPTPAAGDTTSENSDWINVEDLNFEDKESTFDEDGEIRDR
jgi:hypothetical protein